MPVIQIIDINSNNTVNSFINNNLSYNITFYSLSDNPDIAYSIYSIVISVLKVI